MWGLDGTAGVKMDRNKQTGDKFQRHGWQDLLLNTGSKVWERGIKDVSWGFHSSKFAKMGKE